MALPEGRCRIFWEKVLDGPIASLVLDQREEEAITLMKDLIVAEMESKNNQMSIGNQQTSSLSCGGFVWIVGAGPGDPDLLTIG